MSCYFRQNAETSVSIPKYIESSTGVVYYDIKVRVYQVEWLVERRYRDFAQLHEKLVDEISISKKLLPPKKLVGNKNPAFLDQRREQLEKYLQELLIFFRIQLPCVLAEFLDFNKYDIIYLLQDLAKLFNESGSTLLSSKKEFNFSALEVYAISERLCLPCPPDNIEHRGKFDFSHVLDFCTQLEVLIVTPVKDNTSFNNDYNTVDVPIGRSNIIPKSLRFTLNAFRNIKTLKFHGLSTENIVDIAILKPTMQTICVHSTTMTHINQILMCDNIHRDTVVAAASASAAPDDLSSNSSAAALSTSTGSCIDAPMSSGLPYVHTNWSNLAELDLTGNLLTQIDASVRTAPQLRTLVLDQNRIRAVQNLAELSQLQTLSLSVNLIAECIDWHLELGNLVTLNLAQNRLKTLSGLRKLLSLVNLDLSCNLIDELEEVDNVARLPILETLRLTGNPLAGSVDYRPRVLSRFHERAAEISLDSERGTQKELDTALVLSALHTSKMRQMSCNGQR
ncbi:PREDICTED: nischarin [Rhagoletis zephyria]|uniref:nischarin n=1 Tax=Rhagoletis zephyria TaxID=28612 RepID=UPI000811A4C8|nr:PREDICTED: nischarin [Rhagoletis zephyria]XP_017487418.1 PREDICTED: nischarin [Rhagoletis zephyria]